MDGTPNEILTRNALRCECAYHDDVETLCQIVEGLAKEIEWLRKRRHEADVAHTTARREAQRLREALTEADKLTKCPEERMARLDEAGQEEHSSKIRIKVKSAEQQGAWLIHELEPVYVQTGDTFVIDLPYLTHWVQSRFADD